MLRFGFSLNTGWQGGGGGAHDRVPGSVGSKLQCPCLQSPTLSLSFYLCRFNNCSISDKSYFSKLAYVVIAWW